MNLVEGLGVNLDYLKQGAARAQAALGKRFKPGDHPTTPEQIAAFVSTNYEREGARYQGYFARLMEAFLWRFGQHHVRVNPHTWLFESIPMDKRIPRPTLNLVGDKVEAVTGEILKSLPTGVVMPVDGTPLKRRGALIAQAALAMYDEKDKIAELWRMLAEAGIVCGDAYVEVVHDSSNAPVVDLPMFQDVDMGGGQLQPMPLMRPDGTPATEQMALADEKVNALLAMQVMFDRTCTDLDNAERIHSFAHRSLEWACSTWPEHADKISACDAQTQAAQFAARLQTLMLYDSTSPGVPYVGGDGTYGDDIVLMHVLRCKPDKFYPKGRYFIVAGNETVVADELPFGKYMMVHYRYRPVPNSIISYGLVKDLMELDRWIEQIAHQTGMKRRTLGNPFIMAPMGSGGQFAGGDLRMGYGQVYQYKPNPSYPSLKPEVVYAHGGMDASDAKELDFWLNDFYERISGIRRSTQGDRPTGVYSGVLLRQMLAAASVQLSPKLDAFHKAVEQTNCLRLEAIAQAPAAQFPRSGTFPALAGRRLWLEWSASDMADNVTFKVETGAAAALDDATKVEDMFTALKVGLLNPQDPKTQYACLRKLGQTELLADLDPNYSRAMDENADLAAGEDVQLGPFENDAVHLSVHVDWINSPGFTLMSQPAQLATIAHAKAHQDRIDVNMNRAMADAQPPAAGPRFEGTPLPPSAGMPGQAPPQMTPGNGVEGMPQTTVAAQQAPRADTLQGAA